MESGTPESSTETPVPVKRIFRCETCSREYSSWARLEVHKRTHKNGGLSAGGTSKSRASWSANPGTSTSNAKKLKSCTLICEICGNSFSSTTYLTEHMLLHTDPGEKPFKCDYCGKQFRVLRFLKRHIDYAHIETEKAVCEICSKTFKKRLLLLDHIKAKHKEKNHKCPICPKKFWQKRILNKHLDGHRNPEAYECKKCGKKFKTALGIKYHTKKNVCAAGN